MIRAEFEDFTALRFILVNARWCGGNGCETGEEWMELAVRKLPESEELLAKLLIDIIEYLESGEEAPGPLWSQTGHC
jgi:hypothetical protein